MVERRIDFAASAMKGRVVSGSPEALWKGMAFDSRRIDGGELFFALPGERVDGHQFVPQAAARGAGAVVIHQEIEATDVACIRVEDTYEALHALTRAVRREVPKQLAAITGSAGKTTTKELLALMLAERFRVERSAGNFNNLYGFPLSLLNIGDDCEWMVAEMGMSTPGELRQISLLGRPDLALFTNVRPVHLENFDSLRGIAEAKAELLAGLSENGIVVANTDDPEVTRIAERHVAEHPRTRLVRFGFSKSEDLDLRASSPQPLEGREGCRFMVESKGGESALFELEVHGLYNAANALAAAAASRALGVSLAECAQALRAFLPAQHRGELHRLADDVVLVDDVYNSNPEAAKLALDSAKQLNGNRHVAILGDMLELGPDEARFHAEVGQHAADLDFAWIVGVGPLSRHLTEAAQAAGREIRWFADAQAAAEAVPQLVEPGDVVLLKGSRGVGLECVVDALRSTEGAG